MIKNITFLLLVLFSFGISEGFSQTTKSLFDGADAFFGMYVSDGKVDYKAIKNHPETLESLLKKAEIIKVSPSDPNTYKSFWINAYNLSVIKGIIDNYPINSPLDKKGFFDETQYALGGISLTLNDIENKMLRAKFEEARFHFVLVCGAKGCPPLISEAYKPSALESQLQTQAEKSLNKPEFIQVSKVNVALSEIFKWYKEDFTKNGKSEIAFINQFRSDKIPSNYTISYYPYNWQLNSK